MQKPRLEVQAGRWGRSISVAVAFGGARPDQGEALAVLVVEEVGENRRVEARIVELEREIIAAFVGALRPGGPDLGPADVDPVAGGVVVGPVGLRDDADALGLQAQGNDLALELVAGLLERTDVGHVTSPWLFRARDHRGLDGDRPARGDRRRTRSRAGAWRRTEAGELSCLARNGLNRGPHVACPVGWESQGKKVSPTTLRLRRSRRSRPSARSGHGEAVWSARRAASTREDVADLEGLAQEAWHSRRRERSHGVEKGRRLVPIHRADSNAARGDPCQVAERCGFPEAALTDIAFALRRTTAHQADNNRTTTRRLLTGPWTRLPATSTGPDGHQRLARKRAERTATCAPRPSRR